MSDTTDADTSAPAIGAKRSRRALVVDDSAPTRMILQRILEREGLAVLVASSGEQAVGQVQNDADGIDLILIDLVMETMDGVEAIRQIRLLPGGRSCIICPMSSTITPALEEACRKAGANSDILQKPFNAPRMRTLLQGVLVGGDAPGAMTPGGAARSEPNADAKSADVLLEVDIEGAVQRSCGDALMLRQMLEALGKEGPGRIAVAQDLLLQGDLRGVARQLHNLRGEMLNLGMPGLAARLRRLEQALEEQAKIGASGGSAHGPALDAATCDSAHQQLAGIGRELSGTAASLSRLPILQRRAASEPGGHPIQGALDGDTFAKLVSAMRRNEAVALQIAIPDSRWLPAIYPDSTEHSFRQYFDSLDFASALALLGRADAEPADDTDDAAASRRILVVDDAPSTVRLLCRILEGMGSLRFALSGEQALDIARAWTPDLIIADIQMGAMSGLDLCRHLTELPQTAQSPVILLSSDNDVANEVSALSAGASDFIEKPINPARVIGRVNTQLGSLRRQPGPADSPGGNVRNAPIGFVTCTLAGHIAEMNPLVANLLQRPILSFSGQHLCELFESGSRAEVETTLQAIANTSRPASIEARMRGADGGSIPVRLAGWTAPGITGNVLWIAVEDIRDWRLSERRRQEKNESGVIASMAGGIAHEFNNLLNIVIGNLDLALEDETDPRRRQRLAAASNAAERAADISRRLGDTARRDAVAQRAPAKLHDLLDNMWPLLTNAMPANVRLLRVAGNGSPQLQVDTRGLRGALLALLQNACDAMPQGGTVAIRAGADQSEPPTFATGATQFAVIEVRDDGAGLAPETARRAFDPFFTTRSPQHVGLGLTTVHGFVSAHGGRADIGNAPEGGTVVTLRLPAEGAQTPERPSPR